MRFRGLQLSGVEVARLDFARVEGFGVVGIHGIVGVGHCGEGEAGVGNHSAVVGGCGGGVHACHEAPVNTVVFVVLGDKLEGGGREMGVKIGLRHLL